jgi:hypothetical protein
LKQVQIEDLNLIINLVKKREDNYC